MAHDQGCPMHNTKFISEVVILIKIIITCHNIIVQTAGKHLQL